MKRNFKVLATIMLLIVCVVVLGVSIVKAEGSSNKHDERIYALVSEKLGDGIYSYEAMLDFENNNRYTLVSGINCYLIYDNILGDYVEFSRSENSFYSNLDNSYEKIYLAPTYYFYKNGGCIYDLCDNRQISSEEISYYLSFESKLKTAYQETKQTNGTRFDETYISNSYYFYNLKDNVGSCTSNYFPDSCSYIAIEMLLSYYDSVENDNVIVETYDVTSSKAFSSYSAINNASYTQSPGIDDYFHYYMISYGRNLGVTSSTGYSISINDMDLLLDEYFYARGLTMTPYTTTSSTNKYNFCTDAIDGDNPVIINISGTDNNIVYDYLNHFVVGYGYDSYGIYANFGWKNNYHTNTNINNYTITNAFYISFDSSHSHSNNYLWTYNGCSGTICPCGNKTCNHGSYTYTQYSSVIHKKTCNACGYQQNEAHHFQTVGNNQVCSDCGYVLTGHQHSYFYIWKNYTQHTASCLCGNSHDEVHVVPAGSFENGQLYATCLLCGGQATMGIVIQGNNVLPRSINGSYILPNGVIVLVDEDFENYMNGTLVFIYPNDGIIRSSVIPYSIKRNDEKHD